MASVEEGRKEIAVSDLIYVLVTIAAFGLVGGLVVACDRLVGPDGDEEVSA